MSVPKKKKSKSSKKKGRSTIYPNKNHAKLLMSKTAKNKKVQAAAPSTKEKKTEEK